ncbi:MAG: polysaccharide deacetylase family protein [Eubacteriales bacterium]|nr:polysaccharide deacetylase family protein [Eubacteriales bacterium]
MKRFLTKSFLIFFVIFSMLISGCNISGKGDISDNSNTNESTIDGTENPGGTAVETPEGTTEKPQETPWEIDYEAVKPNEAGKIMVIMFHNFIEEYKPGGDKLYSIELESFRQLLQTLYDKDYRLTGLSDYLNNSIDVPAGTIPIIFTFDDGRATQFSLEESDGEFKLNSNTAVGVMEQFYREHPDFGLEGSFFVNLQLDTFKGAGTVSERLAYLAGMGFEIGNHTFGHRNLFEVKGTDGILYEIGGNVSKFAELMPEYTMDTFSLPFGKYPKEFKDLVYEGVYSGISYENRAVLEVGWDPVPSPISTKYNPLALHRVTAPGIEPVDCDLTWWLARLSRAEQYVSDGNPDVFSVPESKLETVDKARIGNKQLITY